MFSVLLWPLLAVWMGLALLVAVGIAGTFAWCAAHVLHDVAVGADGEVWCPAQRRMMRVHGAPRHSRIGVPFAALSACERYGGGRIDCARPCLLDAAARRRPAFAV